MSSELQLDVCHLNRWWRHLVNAYEVKMQAWRKIMPAYRRGDDLVTCRLPACTPGSAPGPTLSNEYGRTLPFTFTDKTWQVLSDKLTLLTMVLQKLVSHQQNQQWLQLLAHCVLSLCRDLARFYAVYQDLSMTGPPLQTPNIENTRVASYPSLTANSKIQHHTIGWWFGLVASEIQSNMRTPWYGSIALCFVSNLASSRKDSSELLTRLLKAPWQISKALQFRCRIWLPPAPSKSVDLLALYRLDYYYYYYYYYYYDHHHHHLADSQLEHCQHQPSHSSHMSNTQSDDRTWQWRK